MENETDFSSRIGARGVVAATLVTLALTMLFFGFLVGIGLWNLQLEDFPAIGSPFWLLGSLAWFASTFVGGFVAASATRSMQTRDGVFNALATWSASYLGFGVLMFYFVPEIIAFTLDNSDQVQFLLAFLADALSLGVCIYGGVVGSHFERAEHKARVEAREQRFLRPAHA